MRKVFHLILLAVYFFSGCVGVDYLDDEIVGAEILINSTKTSVLKGFQLELATTYTNRYGLPEEVGLEWVSSNPSIATVANGIVTGISSGQVDITAKFQETSSLPFRITVVEDLTEVASILLTAPMNQSAMINVGQTISFSASVLNIAAEQIDGAGVAWNSSNGVVGSIDENGLFTALANGSTDISAISDGVRSNLYNVNVGLQSKSGEFVGVGSYDASGTVQVFINQNGDVIVELGSDFTTDIALGTFIYLSNSTAGASTRANGLELGEVTGNGAIQFNASSLDSAVGIEDYNYVIVLCKPATITFGYAELK